MDSIYQHIKNMFPTASDNTSDTVIFEAGIHFGEDTEEILNIVCNCSFYGFEPDPRNIEYIKQHEIDKKIHFTPLALSNSIGEVEFHLSNSKDRWSGSSSLKAPKLHLTWFTHVTFKEKTTVKTTTIDHFCQENNIDHIDFIWLDTQGAEKDIIEGGKNMLQKTHFIYFEFYEVEIYEGQPALDDILKLLGPDWIVVEKAYAEILLENKNYKKGQ